MDFQTGLSISSDNGGVRTILVNDGSNSANVDGEISGVISGAAGSVIKTGLGTLLLSNANNYAGLTTVSQGVLLVGGSIADGASVASGAGLGGAGIIAGPVTVNGSPRPGDSIGILTVRHDVTWNGGEAWVFETGKLGIVIG